MISLSLSFSSSSLPLPLFCLLFITLGTPLSLTTAEYEHRFENCRDGTFKCGDITAGFPFHGGDREQECGRPDLELLCDHNTNTTKLEIHSVWYRVLQINPDRQILRISNEEVINKGICQRPFRDADWNLDSPVLTPGPDSATVTLFYDCPSSTSSGLPFFPCSNNNDYSNVSVAIANDNNIHPEDCSGRVDVLILRTSWERLCNRSSDLKGALEKGFDVQWRKEDAEACGKCESSGGACGFYSFGDPGFLCHCPPGHENWPHFRDCYHRPGMYYFLKNILSFLQLNKIFYYYYYYPLH